MPTAACIFPRLYCAILLGIMIGANVLPTNANYYQTLAQSFVEGRLDVPQERGTSDLARFNGRFYHPDGPLPALLMTPFALLGVSADQRILSLAANVAVFYLCFLLARRHEYSVSDACWLAIAFCFGTSFIAVALISWSMAHGLVVVCLFLAIVEYEGKRRLPMIGLLIGLALATRIPAGLNILFFALVTLLNHNAIRDRATRLAKLLLPFAIIAAFLALYNFARFGNPLESGYSYQINALGISFAALNIAGNIAGPALSLANIPTNLWVFLFGLPDRAAVGTSVLLLSPFAVYLAKVRRWDATNVIIVFNVVAVLMAVLAFRSTGLHQVGYRFSLDFLPFVFWLAVRSRIKMTPGLQALIFLATLIDITLVGYFLATR